MTPPKRISERPEQRGEAPPMIPREATVCVPTTMPLSRSSAQAGKALVWPALICAGLVLPVSYLPLGRTLALLLSLVGFSLGSLTFLTPRKTRVWSALAAALNLGLMLAVLLFPTWLGLGPWLAVGWSRSSDDEQTVALVPYQGKGRIALSDPEGWIDANVGGWQRGDLRVTLTEARIGSLPLQGPKGQVKVIKEPVVLIKVRVTNVGAAREIEWHRGSDSRGTEPTEPTLTDTDGKKLALHRFEKGWKPHGQPADSHSILPGETAEQWLVFDMADRDDGVFRLELPLAMFGETGEPIRFRFIATRDEDRPRVTLPTGR